MTETFLGAPQRPRTIAGRVRAMLGNSAHLWMWDEAAVRDALIKTGFVEVRRCRFGDAEDEGFRQVEDAGRFHDAALDIDEVAMEGRKPRRAVR